jgi:hypothetical protein
MRVYPLLLGILLTTGYGYAAQIAVSSLGAGRVAPADPAATSPAPAGTALDGVWYGGVLDPVTVETRSGGTRAAATKARVLSRPTVRCIETGPSRFRAVS